MRRVLLVVPLCLAALLIAAIGPQWAAAAGWTPLDYSSEFDLNGVACADAAHVWAVGDLGVIVHSDSGGMSWTGQTPVAGVGYSAVACADPAHVWAVGGTVVATTDGGTTWTPQTSGTTQHLTGLAHADASHLWAVGNNGTVLVTTDGGARWTAQDPGATNALDAVACPDASHAWVGGGKATTAGRPCCARPTAAPPGPPRTAGSRAVSVALPALMPRMPGRWAQTAWS